MKKQSTIYFFFLFYSVAALKEDAPYVPNVIFQEGADLYEPNSDVGQANGPENIKIIDGGKMAAPNGGAPDLAAKPKPAPHPKRLVVYSNGKSEIIVKDLDSRSTLKLFTIQIEQPTGGLQVDYKNDLIFFAHKDHVYRIHLVDDDGERKISGEGELLRNDSANHLELSWRYKMRTDGSHLVLDEVNGMLYLLCKHGYFKIDAHSMTKVGYGSIGLPSPSNFVLCDGILYAKGYHKRRKTHYLYNLTLNALDKPRSKGTGPKWTRLEQDGEFIDRFVVDPETKRIFFTQKQNILGVVDDDATRSPIATVGSRMRIVMADSAFTRDVGSMRVDGDVVVWSSNAWKVFYVGTLNRKKKFLLKQNIHVLDNHLYGPEHDISSNIVTINV